MGSKKGNKHPEKALKGTFITNAKPGQHADGNGLYLVVEPNGAKHWIFRAVFNGKRRKVGLGPLSTVSVTEAREKAREYKETIRKGGDLAAHIQKGKMPTFKKAAMQVHEEFKGSWKNPKHVTQWINSLKEYVFPEIGELPVDRIDSSHIHKVLNLIWLEKPETARRVRQRVRTVLDWAKAKKYRTGDNPVDLVSVNTRALPKQTERQRHHAALPYAEIPAFVSELQSHEKSAEIIRLALEFIILTAVRTSEARFAKRTEVQASAWHIPRERMKAGEPHSVPLAPRCVTIVKRAIELGGESELLFPHPDTGKPLSENAFLQLLSGMGKAKQFTVHGFRSSFRDWCAERTSYPSVVAEMALAHRIRDKVEAAYLRTKLFKQRREMMATWAAFVAKTRGRVVRLHSSGRDKALHATDPKGEVR